MLSRLLDFYQSFNGRCFFCVSFFVFLGQFALDTSKCFFFFLPRDEGGQGLVNLFEQRSNQSVAVYSETNVGVSKSSVEAFGTKHFTWSEWNGTSCCTFLNGLCFSGFDWTAIFL